MQRCFRDHLGRALTVSYPPPRVVSLCPSLTETLFALGLRHEIVGRTEYCIHPADLVERVPTVGGTKSVSIDRVLELRPDLVIAEKEENRREDVERLAAHAPVFVVDVMSFDDALRAIRDLGEPVARDDEARMLASQIEERFDALPRAQSRRVAYLIWRRPYRAVGRDTYIDSLLGRCGLVNVCAEMAGRYPTIALDELRQMSPELVLLSSEPFPFVAEHVAELATKLPESTIRLVDGEMFGWYGSRMLPAADYLRRFLDELA